jgi:UDP-glucose 4-epimerase
VVHALQEAGLRVRAFTRTPPSLGLLPAETELCQGDIVDAKAVAAAMQGCQMVVHLAALLHLTDPSPAMRPLYEQINVEGTRIVVEAAQAAGVQRLLFGSTISVYGASQGQVINESTPPRPTTLYGETKLAAEALVLGAKAGDGEPLGVVLRFATVYGPRVQGNYRQLVQSLARGRFLPLGAGENQRTLIYDRDLAQAVCLALTHPAAAGEVFNVTDGRTHTMRAILGAICAGLGRNQPRIAIPLAPVRLAARWLGNASPLKLATLDKYLEDVQVSGQRIQHFLGFVPHFDLVAGWQETVESMRQQGELP